MNALILHIQKIIHNVTKLTEMKSHTYNGPNMALGDGEERGGQISGDFCCPGIKKVQNKSADLAT